MENHTKRIRKARRQGLATRKDTTIPTPRRARALRVPGSDEGPPRADARRKTLLTGRKTKRQVRNAMRRMGARGRTAGR